MDQSCGAQRFHCGYCSVASPRDHLQEVTWTNCVEHRGSTVVTVVLLALEITSRR